MYGGAWWATVHGVTKSQTRLSVHLFFFFKLFIQQVFAAGIQNSLVAASGLNPGPLHWEHGVLATRPPGLHFYLEKIDFLF